MPSDKEYSNWNTLSQGNYSKVSINPKGTRIVKTPLTGKNGKKRTFNPHKVKTVTKLKVRRH